MYPYLLASAYIHQKHFCPCFYFKPLLVPILLPVRACARANLPMQVLRALLLRPVPQVHQAAGDASAFGGAPDALQDQGL